MKLLKITLLLSLLLIVAAGCQSDTPAPAPASGDGVAPDPAGGSEVVVVSRVPEQLATPLPGNANLTGNIFSTATNAPLIQLPIQLADVIRTEDGGGNFVLDTAHSHTTYTDASGNFLFADIPAGEYVMVVGNVEVNQYEVVTKEDGRPRVFTAVADQIVNIDTVQVGLEWFSTENIPAPSDGYPAPSSSNGYP